MFEGDMLSWITDRSLADIIRDNTGIEWIQDNVFITAARRAVDEPVPLAMFVIALAMLIRRKQIVAT
jgi:hypothetical protein